MCMWLHFFWAYTMPMSIYNKSKPTNNRYVREYEWIHENWITWNYGWHSNDSVTFSLKHEYIQHQCGGKDSRKKKKLRWRAVWKREANVSQATQLDQN